MNDKEITRDDALVEGDNDKVVEEVMLWMSMTVMLVIK